MEMTDSIRFSIVVVNYNMGKYLEDALLSIIHQDYPKELIQLIVIDGGSKDNSVDIIKKYASHIYYWVSEPDKGQSDAFNKGFKQASHEWLFWLNADDFLLKDALRNIASAMKKELKKDNAKKWFCFDSMMANEEGICLKVFYGPQWNNFFMQKLGPQVHSPTSIFHRDLFYNSKGFDIKLNWSMDLDLWVQFFKMGYQYTTIHKFTYVIRMNEQSKTLSGGPNSKPSKERLEQSGYMWNKNNFYPNSKYIPYWRIYKGLTILPSRLIYHIIHKNKKLIWWRTL